MTSLMVIIAVMLVLDVVYFSRRVERVYSCFEVLDDVEVLFKRDRLEHLQAWLQVSKKDSKSAILTHKSNSVETISVYNRLSRLKP